MFPPDILTIASKLVKITNEHTITLSTAESCTGGLIAGAITEIPGSSSVFHRGYVTYSNLAKQQAWSKAIIDCSENPIGTKILLDLADILFVIFTMAKIHIKWIKLEIQN